MNNEREPNVCMLKLGLELLREAADTGQSLFPALEKTRYGLEKVDDIQAYESFPKKIDEIQQLLNNSDADRACREIDSLIEKLNQNMPRFRIVLINETQYWQDKALVKSAGEIWAAYLYDENRKVHMCDIRPSYEMRFLYSSSKNMLSEAQQEILMMNDSEDMSLYCNMSMYCNEVDAMKWSQKLFCGVPSDTGAEDYRALEESEVKYYKSNICIDLPGSINVVHVLDAARQQLLGGVDLTAISTLKTLAATDEIGEHRSDLLAIIELYQKTSDIKQLNLAITNLESTMLEPVEDRIESDS